MPFDWVAVPSVVRAWRFFSASVSCAMIGMPSSFCPVSAIAFCTDSSSLNSTYPTLWED